MNGFTGSKQCEIDWKLRKIRTKSSSNLRSSSLSFFVIALFDAGMSPKQTDAERWINMLETKAYREASWHCQTCLGKPLVVRTFWLNALKNKVTPLSNNRVRWLMLCVRERSVSSKEERWKTVVIVLLCVLQLILRRSDCCTTITSNRINHHGWGNGVGKQEALRTASKQRNATAKEAHGAYRLLFLGK